MAGALSCWGTRAEGGRGDAGGGRDPLGEGRRLGRTLRHGLYVTTSTEPAHWLRDLGL